MEASAGGGLLASLGLVAVLMLVSLLYVQRLGLPMLMAAVGTVAPETAAPAPVPVIPGAPAPAPAAPGVVATIPLPRRTVALLAVVLLVVVASSVGAYLLMSRGGDGGGGGGEGKTVDIESLEEFTHTISMGNFLQEGAIDTYALQDEFLAEYGGGTGTFFVDRIELVLTWTDEPDRQNPLATYENQPDTFGLGMEDVGEGNISLNDEGSNTHGAEGMVMLQWASPGWWVAWGNTSLDVDDMYTVSWGLDVDAMVDMMVAGNMIAPRRPIAYTDDGNDYSLEVTVSGRVYGTA